jgi:hypothetical protein
MDHYSDKSRVDDSAQRPTCSLFLQTPFTSSGLAQNLNLEPFDADNIARRSESLVTYCVAMPYSLHPKMDQTTVVACDACTYGYSDHHSALTCNPSPLCKTSEDCTSCQLSAFHPFTLVPCETCISKVCGMNGNCQCVF